jgi:hypothetical protein
MTGATCDVSAVVSFFEESTRQPARKSGKWRRGKREAGRGKREAGNWERELSIGGSGERGESARARSARIKLRS